MQLVRRGSPIKMVPRGAAGGSPLGFRRRWQTCSARSTPLSRRCSTSSGLAAAACLPGGAHACTRPLRARGTSYHIISHHSTVQYSTPSSGACPVCVYKSSAGSPWGSSAPQTCRGYHVVCKAELATECSHQCASHRASSTTNDPRTHQWVVSLVSAWEGGLS
jgi:hypothetical protein